MTDNVVFGELTGWREWRLKWHWWRGWSLRSLVSTYEWQPGVNEALVYYPFYFTRRNKPSPYKPLIPSLGQDHGFYAYYRESQCYLHANPKVTMFVTGRVALWGEVIQHELGYRAQYARIIELTHIKAYGRSESKKNKILEKLRKRYLDVQPTPHEMHTGGCL